MNKGHQSEMISVQKHAKDFFHCIDFLFPILCLGKKNCPKNVQNLSKDCLKMSETLPHADLCVVLSCPSRPSERCTAVHGFSNVLTQCQESVRQITCLKNSTTTTISDSVCFQQTQRSNSRDEPLERYAEKCEIANERAGVAQQSEVGTPLSPMPAVVDRCCCMAACMFRFLFG